MRIRRARRTATLRVIATAAVATAAVAAAAAAAGVVVGAAANAAPASVTQQLDPPRIGLQDAARLTIAASGDGAPPIAPPEVAGLEFVAISQTQQIQSINGVTRSTSSVTYQVIARHTGVFTIPGLTPSTPPVVLTVSGGNPPPGAAQPGTLPAVSNVTHGTTDAAQVSADGMAFVRLRVAKHELYVGQVMPIDIEVGTRDGFVVSLNGPPSLNGDAFGVSKLSSEPQRTQETVDGKPFTVFTWHGALSAVKPGDLSLTMETPLTVRIRDPAGADDRSAGGLEDLFNDPTLQNFFGGSTEKDVLVTSDPAEFKVSSLPTENRPADFSGAVGHFTIATDLSQHEATVGDPLTLRLHIAGTGNFDRVSSAMLHDAAQWKTYAPTASFTPTDDIGYRGEKTFEQPIAATKPGAVDIPPLAFSYFDPDTRRYETVRAETAGAAIAAAPAPSARPSASPAPSRSARLKPDHDANMPAVASLRPSYYQPGYMAAPAGLILAFGAAWYWLRRRQGQARAPARVARAPGGTVPLVALMDEASTSNDPALFFKSARSALQRTLASQWNVKPDNITLDDVSARLGGTSDVARVFMLADESAYAGLRLDSADFQHWKRLILRLIGTANPEISTGG